MAKKSKHASVKPSEAEAGGGGIPVGAICEITEAKWGAWEEAGEAALKNNRKAEDPALIITVEMEGVEEPKTEFLGAGKATRLVPSDDGDYLDVAEGSTATALSDSCNAKVFLDSIFYKDKKSKAFKRHGDMAIHEDALDEGISSALVGLSFVADRIKIDRSEMAQDPGQEARKDKPTLIAGEIKAVPGGKKSGKTSGKKKTEEEEEEEEDEKPKRTSKGKAKDEDEGDDADEAEKDCEKAVLAALELPKYRKGIEPAKAFQAVLSSVRGEDNEKAILAFAEDEDWLKHKRRPWSYDKDEDKIVAG